MSFDFPKPVLATIIGYTLQADNLCNTSLVCKRWKEFTDIVCQNMLHDYFEIDVTRNFSRRQVIEMTHILNDTLLDQKLIEENKRLESIFDISSIKSLLSTDLCLVSILMQHKIKRFNATINTIDKLFPRLQSAFLTKTILIRTCGNLYFASKQKNYSSVIYFFENCNIIPQEIQHAFLPACESGNIEIVRLFIENNVNVASERAITEHETYLTAAVKSGSISVVRLLVNNGANHDEPNSSGETPLALSARINTSMFNIFSELTSSLSQFYGLKQKTIAHYAAKSRTNTSNIIFTCVSRNASIDHQDVNGVTPLMTAIEAHNPEVFYTLIECGASIEIRCMRDWTPLHYAVHHQRDEYLKFLCERKPGKWLQIEVMKFAASKKNFSAVNILSDSLGIKNTAKIVSLIGAGALAFFAWINLRNS